MNIIFSRKGVAVSAYQIEEYFQENKNNKVINISCEVLLTRFRLGVKQQEILPFTLIVKDIDNTLVKEKCSIEGKLCEVWDTKILRRWETMMLKLL
jgi:hypothetical protein